MNRRQAYNAVLLEHHLTPRCLVEYVGPRKDLRHFVGRLQQYHPRYPLGKLPILFAAYDELEPVMCHPHNLAFVVGGKLHDMRHKKETGD